MYTKIVLGEGLLSSSRGKTPDNIEIIAEKFTKFTTLKKSNVINENYDVRHIYEMVPFYCYSILFNYG